MTNIQQILGSAKTASATNKGVSFPMMLDSEQQTYTEYNVFRRINQLDQFYTDKKNCKYYRFYGHINEAVNLKFKFTGQPKIKPDFTHFDLTKSGNWRTYLMAPLIIGSGTTENRGDYEVTTTYDGLDRTLNFRIGLPSLVIKSQTINNKTRRGLLVYLGHNFKANDLLELTDIYDSANNGTYRVVYVLGNKIYLQTIAVATNPTGSTVTAVNSVKIGQDEIELGVTDAEYTVLAAKTGVNWLAVINPHIFVKKLVNKTPCEYYMKKLYSIGTLGAVTNCGYASNSYSQKTFSYTKESKNYFESLRTNLMAPITDVYVVFVKNVVTSLQMSSIQANFANFMGSTFDAGRIEDYCFSATRGEYVVMPEGSAIYEGQSPDVFMLVSSAGVILDGEVTKPETGAWSRRSGAVYLSKTGGLRSDGIQTVNSRYALDDANNPDNVDYSDTVNFLYHSLVEYSNETLTEIEIQHVEHTFLCNINDILDNHVRFVWNPFHRVPIRVFSKNIEERDVYFGLPDYAVYSEKYQTYRWRHILEIGYFEAQGNGVDFSYLNDAFYVFSNILLNIKNYSSPKINSLLTGGYLISAYTDTLTQTDTTNTTGNDGLDESLLDKNKNDKPFEQFNGSVC